MNNEKENDKNLNDFIIGIFQDFVDIESMMKIIKDSVYNENGESTANDLGNTLEIVIAKMTNTKNSLNKFIEDAFNSPPNDSK